MTANKTVPYASSSRKSKTTNSSFYRLENLQHIRTNMMFQVTAVFGVASRRCGREDIDVGPVIRQQTTF